jgi:hypothetical protein
MYETSSETQQRSPVLKEKEIKMFTNVSNNIAAAFAALVSAAVFVGASVGPAINNAGSLVI